MKSIISRFAFAAVIPLALTAGASALQAQEAMAESCTASFSAETVTIQSDPVMLTLTLSNAIGDIEHGTAAEKSGLVVTEVTSGEEGIALYLDTSKGKTGEWQLSFKGSEGACSGIIKVNAAEATEENAPESGEG